MIASASCPVRFSSSARYDEESESPIMPVCGDRAATAILLEVVMPVPANGDVAKMRGFSGPSGSAPGGQSRSRSRLASPMPPMTSAKTSGANGSLQLRPRLPPGRLGAIARGRHRCSRSCGRGHGVTRRQRSPRGAPTFRRAAADPIASELLVDDEAVAVEWPAGARIEHATGKGGAAPHEVSGRGRPVSRRSPRADARPMEQTRYTEELDRSRRVEG